MEEEGEERERKETNETETTGGETNEDERNETKKKRKEILMPTLHLSLKQEKSPGRPEGRKRKGGGGGTLREE